MAVTAVTTTMAGAINYTVVTDTSADWPSVAFSTYFYDKTDKLVHYKDSAGNIQEIFSGSGITVGTTAVTSGTDGRVFFQAGGVVQQSANLFWDNTNNTLGIGTSTPSSSFKLDVNGDARFNGGATSSFGTQILNVGIRILTNAGNSGGISLDSNLPVGNRLNFNSNFTIRSNSSITSGVDISLFTNSVQNSTNTVSLAGISGNVFSTSGGNNQTNGFLINPTINLNAGNVSTIFRGIHYSPTLTSTTGLTHRAIETTTGDVIFGSTSGNVVIGSTSPGARLDVRAQGALSTDIAFRVRNSADTQNLVSFHGDGRFLIGQNASNTCIGGVPQYAIAIGASAAVSGASETYGSPIAIGYDAQSVGTSALAIGNSTRPNTGIAIGHGVQSRAEGVAIGGSTTNARGTVMGSGSSNSGYGGSSIGYDVDNTGDGSFLIGYFHSNSIASSFVWGSNGIKFWVNSNSNLVLANNKAITDANKATYVDTSATNTFTIHSGTAPVANITDAFQQYSADITAGNAAPHFRTENGAIVKVYQETTAVGASTLVSNAGTNITDTDTFDGYTLKQIVKALRNQGLLA